MKGFCFKNKLCYSTLLHMPKRPAENDGRKIEWLLKDWSLFGMSWHILPRQSFHIKLAGQTYLLGESLMRWSVCKSEATASGWLAQLLTLMHQLPHRWLSGGFLFFIASVCLACYLPLVFSRDLQDFNVNNCWKTLKQLCFNIKTFFDSQKGTNNKNMVWKASSVSAFLQSTGYKIISKVKVTTKISVRQPAGDCFVCVCVCPKVYIRGLPGFYLHQKCI